MASDNVSNRAVLFGGSKKWKSQDWTDSDDRVRGGKSQSHMRINEHQAIFCGNLDIDTLGSAGFASQRTTGNDRHWNLSKYDGVEIQADVSASDTKTYTFILKDEILPADPETGREQASISWEYDFQVSCDNKHTETESRKRTIFISWDAFKPTYRGKTKKPPHPLKITDVRRMSVMMRSHFGAQKGHFRLCLYEIAVVKHDEKDHTVGKHEVLASIADSTSSLSKHQERSGSQDSQGSWTRWLFKCCRL